MKRENMYYRTTNAEKVKALGQYFTPDVIAEFMAKWVSRDATTVLDPAAGNHIFFRKVRQANPYCQFYGYEIDPEIAMFFDEGRNYNLVIGDFLLSEWDTRYDGIICNPPYNRFQAIENRDVILEAFKKHTGTRYSGYTNQYILFLIKSISHMSHTGKLAFLIPSEFLNSEYGAEIKHILLEQHLLRAIIHFGENIFPNSVTTSCIVLLDKEPKDSSEFVYLDSIDEVKKLDLSGARLSHDSWRVPYQELRVTEKWRTFLNGESFKEYPNCVELSKFCRVSRGIATGDNGFFLFNKQKVMSTGIEEKYFKMCVSQSRDVKTHIFCRNELEQLKNSQANVYLLFTNDHEEVSDNLQEYINQGLAEGVHEKYLPSRRDPWYSMEAKEPSPIWVGTAGRHRIKVVRNLAGVLNLTTFHSVFMKPEYEYLVDIFFCYLLTPIAQAIIQENRKELGNGLHKYQPGDLNSAKMLDLELITDADAQLITSMYQDMCYSSDDKYISELDGVFRKYIERV